MADTTPHILLTVSGVIPEGVAEQARRGERPTPDYIALARDLGAELLDVERARTLRGGAGGLIERILGRNALLALACFAKRSGVDVILTDGEQVGIPLALLLKCFGRGKRRARHVMIAHRLTVKKKRLLLDSLRLYTHVDTFLVYASVQQSFIERRWRIPRERVALIPFQVDTGFYSPELAQATGPEAELPPGEDPLISAIGLERRDYTTLLKAVTDLPVRLFITASSAWSKQTNDAEKVPIPANARVGRLSYAGLRKLYADSVFTVLPLQAVDFQAGVTAILESLAMERPVICSRVEGQTDVIVEGESGTYVPPADASALRAAIIRLLADPALTRAMGRAGRELVERRMSLEHYARWIREASGL